MKTRLAPALAALLAPCFIALAQEHGGEAAHGAAGHAAPPTPGVLPTIAEGIAPMIVSLVVFALVLAILSKTAWPKIAGGLRDREQKIRSEIEAAELAQKQAKAALEQYEKNLAEARAEAQKMLDQTRVQQQALAAELKAKNDADISQMRERATRDIDSAKRAALNEIYQESARIATSIASKILQREVTPGDQSRLVEESLRELATVRN
jgi:F-type H+-transporting ATPase subunit b